MQLLGYEITLTRKAARTLTPIAPGRGGWWPLVREPDTGAWQRNQEVSATSVLANPYVFACVRLIASDIGKLRLRLVEVDADGIWTETTNPAYSPLLRHPNDYQQPQKFIEQWAISILTSGNVFVRKTYDARGVVDGLYVLDPARVRVLVTEDGGVYYDLTRDELNAVPVDTVVPAREIIHDRYLCLYHPLIGVPPLYAAALAAVQGIQMQENSSSFFANGARPAGIIMVPGDIDKDTAQTLKADWEEKYKSAGVGGTGVLSNGMSYQALTMSAVDAQLIDQLKWTGETICTAFGVPIYMVDESKAPSNYTSNEPRIQHYYSETLQPRMTGIETCLDAGIGLGPDYGNRYGAEFDITDLIWMDTATKTKAAAELTGALSPNEIRRDILGYKPVTGGDSPLAQQQYYSLEALAKRDAAAAPPDTPPPTPTPDPAGGRDDEPMPDEGVKAADLPLSAVPLAFDALCEELHTS